MKNLNRRDVFLGLSAIAAMSSVAAVGQTALPGGECAVALGDVSV